MLYNFALVLIEMLYSNASNFQESIDNILAELNIDPELRAILYECIHAKDKIS